MAPLPPLVCRYLVPAERAPLPDGYQRVTAPLVRGVPFPVTLDRELTLTLLVPIGRAQVWRDADPAQVATSSDADEAPNDPATEGQTDVLGRLPVRFVLSSGGNLLAAAPLRAGATRTLPDDGSGSGTRIELVVLAWEVRAGSVADAGDTGSRIDFAWRRIDVAPATFVQPRLDPRIAARMPAETAVQSELGGEGGPLPLKETQP